MSGRPADEAIPSVPAVPAAPPARWSLGRLFVALVAVALLPIGLIVGVAVMQMTAAATEQQRTALLLTAGSIRSAVDAELGRFVAIAEALAGSPALARGDLAAFAAEATRLVPPDRDAWVVLADADGRQLVNTRAAAGTALPVRPAAALAAQRRALASRATAVSDVYRDPLAGDWQISVNVAVPDDGEPTRAVAINVRADRFVALLRESTLASSWLTGIMDSAGRFVARWPYREPGQPVSEGWRATRATPGIAEFLSLDGVAVTNANALSTASPWTIGVGASAADLRREAWRTIAWSMGFVAAVGVAALLLALALGRRLQAALNGLRDGLMGALRGQAGQPAILLREFTPVWTQVSDAITQRRRFEDRVRTSEAQLRLVADIVPISIAHLDRDGTYKFVNQAYAERFGLSVDQIVGQRIPAIAGAPAWDATRAHVARCLAGEAFSVETEISYAAAGRRWMYCAYVPERAGGEVVGLVAAFHDITAARRAAADLRESEQRLSLAKAAAGLGIHDYDVATGTLHVDARVRQLWGMAADAPVTFDGFVAGVHPDDRDAMRRGVAAALAPGGDDRYAATYRVVGRGDGGVRWIEATGQVAREGDRATRLVGTVLDITAHKEAQERLRLVTDELDHRSKNLMALVQSVARLTSFTTRQEFLDRFSARLQALSSAQDLLVRHAWKGAELAALVRTQLGHFAELIGTRIVVDGPPVVVNAQAAQALAMAVHELATNAGKYGALSTGRGRVAIAWQLRSVDGAPQFTLAWTESDGPPVQPPARAGFGTTVIGRMITMALRCTPVLAFDPAGFSWTVACPAETVLAPAAAADATAAW